ncbi:MAG TPA: cupin domain-containing protein [Solirubrobacteraceae bacterium]|jgi:quercetin dioxygenase-like cupin family protein|nr:cupin domain-containing protein [Solirubrobacteraceae bacterium]
MPFGVALPAELTWETRPHEPGEPARHVAELSEQLGSTQVPSNLWRYEPGARGKRHVHAIQEETFVVLSGALTMYVGEPAERVDVPFGGAITIPCGVALQTANHGEQDLLVYAYGCPPDQGATVIDPVV